jgi:tetratricopeptide (TPR) repeat protein
MNFNDARKILGLGPDEDPRPHLAEFRLARERIAEMVRNAPNENLAMRYQEGLIEFDRALAACREYLEALGLASDLPPSGSAEEPAPVAADTPSPATTKPRRSAWSWAAWLLVFLTGAAGGGWLYLKNEWELERQRAVRIEFLNRQGSLFVENRRWDDASQAFAEIERLDPGSELSRIGRRSIEAGMEEEQNQFIGYWTGQAIAELDAGRLDEAEAAARHVLERFPVEKEAAAILGKVAEARSGLTRQRALVAARRLLDERQWQPAIDAARRLLAEDPANADASAILTDATAALEKESNSRSRAAELHRMAAARDHGEFDQQALDWLREAASLDPENREVAALLEKMSSYTRTIRVPGDFATPAEALAAARDRDRIVLGEQTWKGPLVLNVAADLQGAGSSLTTVECPPAEGPAITIGPAAKGARISGIAFRHETFLPDGSERFAVALVRGGSTSFVDCRFSEASGHGLAVIEQGQVLVSRCRFSDNGWNGASAIGAGSSLEVRDSESLDNFGHGIESWDGATITVINNRCEGNSRNGIHAEIGKAAAVIEGNQLIANREFGLVLTSAGSGRVTSNIARDNLLGGYVIRSAASAVPVTGNQATRNRGPGLVLEKGLRPADFTTNTLSENIPQQTLAEADLSDSH